MREAMTSAQLSCLLREAIRSMPFEANAYRQANPDVDVAFRAGQITDLHAHFIESGYLEGRSAAAPQA